MKILLTNDDGIDAIGLRIMGEALFEAGHEVFISAPDGERSSISHGLTVRSLLRVEESRLPFAVSAYKVFGTPADCVKIALHNLLSGPVDLIISGINSGANIGTDCLYSGTVAAAVEGAVQGYRAIAVSRKGNQEAFYDTAAKATLHILSEVMKAPIQAYNLITPEQTPDKKMVIRTAPLAHRRFCAPYEKCDGGYKMMWGPDESLYASGSDMMLLKNGYAVLTPLLFNWTDTAVMKTMKKEDVVL